LANSPEARTPTGEIKDANTPPTPPPEAPKPPEVPPAPTGQHEPPESYTEFKAPEGYKLAAQLVTEATPLFKDLKLTQDQAQKLVDWYSKNQIAIQKQIDESVSSMRKEWKDGYTNHPDLAGKLETVRTDIGRALMVQNSSGQRVIDAALEKDFRDALDLTGAGDHPAVIRVLSKFAGLVNEGKHVSGGGPSPLGQTPTGQVPRPSPAKAMYPNLPSSTT